MNDRKLPYWIIFTIIAVGAIVLACVSWIQAHPYGISWDESEYFCRALSDLASFRHEGVIGLGRSILFEDRIRPPAYRILAIPFTVIFGFQPLVVRLVSLSFFIISLLFVYLTARRMAGPMAGAFAAIFLCLCPIMIFPSMVFGTEYPLFLATAAMMYFIFHEWNRDRGTSLGWIGLGLALGIGSLAKVTFIAIAGPALVIGIFLSYTKRINRPTLRYFYQAFVLAALIALPWWLVNLRPALWYARYGANFEQHSLDVSFVNDTIKWFGLLITSYLGPALSLLVLIIAIVLFVHPNRNNPSNSKASQVAAIILCFLASLPLILISKLGKNDNLRFFSPSLILIALGLGMLVSAKAFILTRKFAYGASFLFLVQLIMFFVPIIRPVVYPENAGLFYKPPWLVFAQVEQWDWEPLRELAITQQIEEPAIAFLGSAREFNWPAITYPWALHREGLGEVRWLWNQSNGQIDWDQIMKSIGENDLVLTAPNMVSLGQAEDMNNQYNLEFTERLMKDSRFSGPVILSMGRFTPTDVYVFIKSRNN